VKIEWSLLAIEDRNKIFDFIEQDDPRAAIFVDERIEEQTKILDLWLIIIHRLHRFPQMSYFC